VARHRRGLAALAVGLAALSALSALRPAPPPTQTVAVAARDLPSGTRLAADDVRTAELPPGAVPDGTYLPAEVPFGRLVAAPVRRGETLTDARVVGQGLAAGLPGGQVLTSVPVATATTLLVRPGDAVDVVAGHAGHRGTADVVAAGATVVAVPKAGSGSQDRTLVLAVDETAALGLVQAALVTPLQVLVRPP
jgi:Flp pilus assembly protein CpaB